MAEQDGKKPEDLDIPSYARHCLYVEPRLITHADGTTGKARSIGVSMSEMEKRIAKKKADMEAGVIVNTMAPPRVIERFEAILGEKLGPEEKYLDVVKKVLDAQKQKEIPEDSSSAVASGMQPSTEQMSVFLLKNQKKADYPGLPDEIIEALTGTVSALGEFLSSGDGDSVLEIMRVYEVDHKNRSTALSVINGRIKEVG
jgi:hypothetical protein